MQSDFIKTAKELVDQLGVLPLLTSANANWDQAFLAHYEYPGAVLDTHKIPFHCLEVIDYGAISPHYRLIGEKRSHNDIHGGEIFLCPADTEHRIIWTKKLNFSLLVFNPIVFEQLAEELEISKPIEFIPQLHSSNTWIQKAINTLKIHLKNGCPDGSIRSQEIIIELIKVLLDNYTTFKTKILKQNGKLANNILKEVLEFIDVNLENEFDLNILAKKTHYDIYHFRHLFKNSVGISPGQYILLQRIERAQVLLKKTSYPIKAVAKKYGFADQRYFTKIFRKKLGICPTEFREQCKYVQIII